MTHMSTLGWIATILVVVGGLNWGLVGALDFNLVAALFGAMPIIERAVYVLVGLSAIYMIVTMVKKPSASAARPGGMETGM